MSVDVEFIVSLVCCCFALVEEPVHPLGRGQHEQECASQFRNKTPPNMLRHIELSSRSILQARHKLLLLLLLVVVVGVEVVVVVVVAVVAVVDIR